MGEQQILNLFSSYFPEEEKILDLNNLYKLQRLCDKKYKDGTPIARDQDYDKICNQMNQILKNVQISADSVELIKLSETLSIDVLKKLERSLPAGLFYDLILQQKTEKENYKIADKTVQTAKNLQDLIEKLRKNIFESVKIDKNTLKQIKMIFDQAWNSKVSKVQNEVYDVVVLEIGIKKQNNYPELVDIPRPICWVQEQELDDPSISLFELDKDGEEFMKIKSFFVSNLTGGYSPFGTSPCAIARIDRIQNPGLYRLFEMKKQELLSRGQSANEKWMFHGVPTFVGVRHIIKYGFRQRFCPGGAIGDGIYFATHSEYSNNAPYICDYHGTKTMFVARVTVGVSVNGSPGSKKTHGADSHDYGTDTGHCIFDYTQAYPDYVIQYTPC